jgi:ATP adenylyltransferase
VNNLKKIWAPWRIEYILQPKDDECFICNAINANPNDDAKNLLLHRGKKAVVLINKFPYISGHLMIAPTTHTDKLTEVSNDIGLEIWKLTTQSVELLKKAISPEGFNIGMNLGKIAGAGLETHVHLHIVPRWAGDTNFMPVISNTRVISQALDELFELLKKDSKKFYK